MKYLVIGASGFLGCTIYKRLKDNKQIVFGTYSSNKLDDELIYLDLMNIYEIVDIYQQIRPDIIIWSVRNYEYEEIIADTSLKNLLATLNGKTRFIFISTQLAYLKNMDENIIPMPRTEDMYSPHYFNGKIRAEYYIAQYENYVILRPGSIYGIDAYGNYDGRTKELIEHMENEEKYVRTRNICFSIIEVNELAQAVIELSQNEFKGIINISEEIPISHFEFGRAMCKKYHVDDQYLKEDFREECIYYLDNTLRKKVLITKINELER